MNFRKYLVPAGIVLLLALAWRSYGWQGIFAVGGGLMMWALLHFTRLVNVMNKAAQRPIGHVGSAVMLNAKLRAGVNLMHVVAMTRALGERLSAEGEEPERYRWTDGTQSSVCCEFRNGRLVRWELVRPSPEGSGPAAGTPAPIAGAAES